MSINLVTIILEKIHQRFKNDLFRLNHILGVHRKAIELARLHKINVNKAQIASLFHDYTKNEPLEFHLNLLPMHIINRYQKTPFIYHAFSAAIILEQEYKVKDKTILNAIRRHVWGYAKMNKLDKIIFISDKIEVNRDYPQINYLRQLALENLDKTVFYILENSINFYKNKNMIIFPEQLRVYESFKIKLRY
ncbi:MAG: bis(5'-nucleosyl)-tetraphosphatase (symmetrical) YqeK [Vigna little leaf phytoplasma]|nr:bis(5'-nucleosyl)-tetraphosphatase (symmetrical) YqeK [Vigna little leaf phytoplasma]